MESSGISPQIGKPETPAAGRESGLEVKQSWLSQEESSTFNGLFVTKHYGQGDVVCIYTGRVYRTSPAQALADKSYLMRIGEQCYIDARESGWAPEVAEEDAKNKENVHDSSLYPPCIARYINDSINPAGHNVVFEKFPLPCPHPPSPTSTSYSSSTPISVSLTCPYPYALVVAKRPIDPGEELFVSYGKWYWAGASLGGKECFKEEAEQVPLLAPYRIPFMELHKRRTDAVAAAAAKITETFAELSVFSSVELPGTN
jgi:hypothetical protein